MNLVQPLSTESAFEEIKKTFFEMGWPVERTVEFYKKYADAYEEYDEDYTSPQLVSNWVLLFLRQFERDSIRILDGK
jgi:hypothetical protein